MAYYLSPALWPSDHFALPANESNFALIMLMIGQGSALAPSDLANRSIQSRDLFRRQSCPRIGAPWMVADAIDLRRQVRDGRVRSGAWRRDARQALLGINRTGSWEVVRPCAEIAQRRRVEALMLAKSAHRLKIKARIKVPAGRREILDPGIGHEEISRLLQPFRDSAVRILLFPLL